MKSRGSVSWWCDCPGRKNGCAEPTARQHRNWYWAIRLDATDRDRVQVKRGGYRTESAATADLERVRALLAVAGDDDEVRRRIADVMIARSRRRGALPDVDEVRRRYGAGLDPVSPATTIGDWLDEWLAGKRRAAASTRDHYALRVALWKRHLGDVPLNRLRGAHVAGALDWLDRRNDVVRAARAADQRPPDDPLDGRRVPVVVGARTQAQIVSVLSMAVGAAVRRGLLARNPVREVELPDPPERRVTAGQVWSPAQVRTFVAATAEHRLGALYRLVLLHGFRRGEVCGLRWSDVDMDARRVTIRRTLRFAGPRRGVGLGRPKTEAGHRVVNLDAGTADALRRIRLRQRQERLAAGAAWRGAADPADDWVFARPDGSPTPPSQVTATFKRLAADIGLPVIRLHDGRHTAATLGFEAGQDVKLVSARLGHANTRITQDLYTHVRDELLSAAADQLGAFVFGAGAAEVNDS